MFLGDGSTIQRGSSNVMGYDEKYSIWCGSSLGGIPLKEASEQEMISSIIGSIVWCLPTSRASIIKWWFSIWFHISYVVIVFRYLWIYSDILYSGIWFLTLSSTFGLWPSKVSTLNFYMLAFSHIIFT